MRSRNRLEESVASTMDISVFRSNYHWYGYSNGVQPFLSTTSIQTNEGLKGNWSLYIASDHNRSIRYIEATSRGSGWLQLVRSKLSGLVSASITYTV